MTAELDGIWGDCNKTDNKTDAINIKEARKMWLMILRIHIRVFCIYGHELKNCCFLFICFVCLFFVTYKFQETRTDKMKSGVAEVTMFQATSKFFPRIILSNR